VSAPIARRRGDQIVPLGAAAVASAELVKSAPAAQRPAAGSFSSGGLQEPTFR